MTPLTETERKPLGDGRFERTCNTRYERPDGLKQIDLTRLDLRHVQSEKQTGLSLGL
jgi:hypothetical protein